MEGGDAFQSIFSDETIVSMVDKLSLDVVEAIASTTDRDYDAIFAPQLMVLFVDGTNGELDYTQYDIREYCKEDPVVQALPIGDAAETIGYEFVLENGLDRLPGATILLSYGQYATGLSDNGTFDDIVDDFMMNSPKVKNKMSECVTIILTTADKRMCGRVHELAEDSFGNYAIVDTEDLPVVQYDSQDENTAHWSPTLLFFRGAQRALADSITSQKFRPPEFVVRALQRWREENPDDPISPSAEKLLEYLRKTESDD